MVKLGPITPRPAGGYAATTALLSELAAAARARDAAARAAAPLRVGVCEWCGTEFEAASPLQVFCAPRCRYAARDARPEVRERNNASHRARYARDRAAAAVTLVTSEPRIATAVTGGAAHG